MTKLRKNYPVAPNFPAAADRKLIVVLGMHRSGTSVITRGLQALGVDLGDQLLPPASDNEKGFFEDTEIVALNDRVLELASRTWHSVEAIDAEFLLGPQCFMLRAEALSLMDAKVRRSPIFGMKDPRLCVLMPFWLSVFEDLEIEPDFVIALRNPLAAAKSLRDRDDFLLEKSVALWGLHMLGAVRATTAMNRIFVSFDAILANPKLELDRMARALNLPTIPEDSPKFLEFMDTFLEPTLRRQLVGERELARSALATSEVSDLYERLAQQVTRDETERRANSELDIQDILVRFANLKPLLRAMDLLYSTASNANNTANELAGLVAATNQAREAVQKAHDDACFQRDQARAEASHLQEHLDAFSLALEQARRHAEELRAARETVQKAHDDACAQRDEAHVQSAHLRIELAERTVALERANDLAAEVEARRDFAQQAHDDACAQRDAAHEQAEQLRAELAAQGSALEAEQLQTAELRAAREIVQRAHDDACAQRDTANSQASRLEAELETHRLSLAQERSRILMVETERDQLTRQMQVRLREIEGLDHRLSSISATIVEYESALSVTTSNLSEAKAQIGQYETELNAARAGWQRSVREIDGERARAETLRIMAQQNAEAVRHLQDSLARAQDESAKYRASTSWKLTAPIRGLSRLIVGETSEQKAQRLRASLPFSAAAWKHLNGNDVPRAALPPPARDPVLRAQRGAVLQAGAPWIAVVIHAFYPELLDDVLDRVARLPVQTKLYVTAPEGAVTSVTASLERHAMPYLLLETDNRGRDMAPFLSALAHVREDGAQLLLKLHTKRSPHLENGDHWRVQLLDSLLDPATAGRAMEALRADPALGLLAPDGHVLSVSAFLGANAGQISGLSRKLGIEQESVEASVFVAGSMFYARPRIFYPLIESAICTSDFEVERGQLDGTLAHGIERLVGALTAKQGMRLSALGDLDEESLPLGRGAYRFV